MARNGSGTYSLPAGNPVVTGTVISSTWANTTLTDLATAMTASVASDGQTPITADIPMNNHKLTGLADGTADGDALNFKQIGTDIPGLSSGSFTGTLTGGTTSPTITVKWYRIGDFVTISLPAKSFTSNATTFTITGGPSSLGNTANWGNSGQAAPSIQALSNGSVVTAQAYVNTDGTIVLILTDSNSWANSGTKGIGLTVVGSPITGTNFSYVIY